MSYKLNKFELKTMEEIKELYYLKPALRRIEEYVEKNGDSQEVWKGLFDKLHDVFERIENGRRRFVKRPFR
jgi:hypothetical protein